MMTMNTEAQVACVYLFGARPDGTAASVATTQLQAKHQSQQEKITTKSRQKRVLSLALYSHRNLSQEALLFEVAEADSLGHLERQVFLKSRILDFDMEDRLSPVSACTKCLAWLFVAIYAAGLAFYVCLFAVKAGRETAMQWMISFWIALFEVSGHPHHTAHVSETVVYSLFHNYRVKESN